MEAKPLAHELFEPHEGTVFRVQLGEDGAVNLLLQEVTTFPQYQTNAIGPEGKPVSLRVPFVLGFSGPKDQFLPHGLRTVTHEALGEICMFIKPYQESGDVFLYEALFN